MVRPQVSRYLLLLAILCGRDVEGTTEGTREAGGVFETTTARDFGNGQFGRMQQHLAAILHADAHDILLCGDAGYLLHLTVERSTANAHLRCKCLYRGIATAHLFLHRQNQLVQEEAVGIAQQVFSLRRLPGRRGVVVA